MKGIRWPAIWLYIIFFLLLFPLAFGTLRLLLVLGLAWKILSLRLDWPELPRLLLISLGILSLILIRSEAPYFWHHPSLTKLCLIMTLLWILDRPSGQQIMLVHLWFFALLICVLQIPGSVYPLPIYAAVTILIYVSLMSHHMQSYSPLSLLSLSRNLLRTAIPAMLFLLPIYFFFPEIRPSNNDVAVSGLSFQLDPGRVANLALSERLVFRARLGQVQRSADETRTLYWRLGVLEDSYGMSWKGDSTEHWIPWQAQATTESASWAYLILPEDRLSGRVPVLEYPQLGEGPSARNIQWNPSKQIFFSNSQLLALRAAQQPRKIDFDKPTSLTHIETSPRVQILVEQLKPLTLPKKIEFLRNFLRDFHYSLKPGTLDSDDPLDQFLFDKRQGFCEHFAAAFASLIRLSGTPARIVTGFRGGEILPDKIFIVVRDADAHAWTEVWDGDHWVRVDPTDFVPGAAVWPSHPGMLLELPLAYLSLYGRKLGDVLAQWLPDEEAITLGLYLGVITVLSLFLIWYLRSLKKLEGWQRELQRLTHKVAQRGLVREPWEPLAVFLLRLSHSHQQLTPEVEQLIPLLNAALYGGEVLKPDRRALRNALRKLSQQIDKLPRQL